MFMYFVFQVNIRGESRHRDDRVTALLRSIKQQPAFVEEFLLREDKALEDYQSFLGQYSDHLDEPVRDFIQERLDEATRSQDTESQYQHREL